MSPTASLENKYTPIIELQALLPRIRRLEFSATPGRGSQTGWAGAGQAQVRAVVDDCGVRLHENGEFLPANASRPVVFRNVYRWRFSTGRVALAHERFGPDAAVALFDLVAAGERELVSAAAHHCGADYYAARLCLVEDGFDLCWSIRGPYKNESLHYVYRC